MKRKVFFRADGSAQIGFGHLIRCIALAQMLQEEFDIIFVCKKISDNIINELKELNFDLLILQREIDFLSLLTGNEIVVIDHYGLDTAYQKHIKDKKSKLVCIDDIHDKYFYADLIINHAPGVKAMAYSASSSTQFALGLDYALLRPAFLNRVDNQSENRSGEGKLFVCFGGTDYKNITQAVVDVLKKDKRFTEINIVVGAGYSNLEELNNSVRADHRIRIYHAIDQQKMHHLIIGADLAIVPASGILQEVLASGCKAISGIYVENQKNIYQNYKALGAIGDAADFSTDNIVSAINEYFLGNPGCAHHWIDGKSGKRLLKYFKEFETEDKVMLIKASLNDLMKTFEWAGNSEIRKFSFNKEEIRFENHKEWFIKKLSDSHCFYYVGLFNQQAFGSIRFDVKGDKAIISYLVDPSYQGKGLGTILLKKGVESLIAEVENILVIYGEVFAENKASVRIFQKLGYSIVYDITANVIKFNKEIVNTN